MTDDAYVVAICAGVLLAAAAAMGLCCGLIGCCVGRKIRGVIMCDNKRFLHFQDYFNQGHTSMSLF